MGKFTRKAPGAGVRKQPKRKPEDGWTGEWRLEGLPKDRRFVGFAEAQAASSNVRQMKPRRLKGRREAKSTRPCPETAERIHHSRGRNWAKFKKSLGTPLSDHEMQLMMDSPNIGGNGIFGEWKQRQYSERKVVDKVIVFDTFHGRKVFDREQGKLVPYIPTDPEEIAQLEARKQKKGNRRKAKGKFCVTCSVRLPASREGKPHCGACVPDTLKKFKASLKR